MYAVNYQLTGQIYKGVFSDKVVRLETHKTKAAAEANIRKRFDALKATGKFALVEDKGTEFTISEKDDHSDYTARYFVARA